MATVVLPLLLCGWCRVSPSCFGCGAASLPSLGCCCFHRSPLLGCPVLLWVWCWLQLSGGVAFSSFPLGGAAFLFFFFRVVVMIPILDDKKGNSTRREKNSAPPTRAGGGQYHEKKEQTKTHHPRGRDGRGGRKQHSPKEGEERSQHRPRSKQHHPKGGRKRQTAAPKMRRWDHPFALSYLPLGWCRSLSCLCFGWCCLSLREEKRREGELLGGADCPSSSFGVVPLFTLLHWVVLLLPLSPLGRCSCPVLLWCGVAFSSWVCCLLLPPFGCAAFLPPF